MSGRRMRVRVRGWLYCVRKEDGGFVIEQQENWSKLNPSVPFFLNNSNLNWHPILFVFLMSRHFLFVRLQQKPASIMLTSHGSEMQISGVLQLTDW